MKNKEMQASKKKTYRGTPLYYITEINGKRYFDHRVFGLVDEEFFSLHGCKLTDEGVPAWEENGKTFIDKDFLKGEKLDKERKNVYNKENEEALESLVREAEKLFN
jgi:hypothetical protein